MFVLFVVSSVVLVSDVVVVVSVETLRHFAACAPVVTLLLIELPPLSLSPLCTQSATNCASESSGNPVCTGFKYKHEDEELFAAALITPPETSVFPTAVLLPQT